MAFPRKLESLHLLITGATGAGKSQTIQGTLDVIRGRGDTAILTDIGERGAARLWADRRLDLESLGWALGPLVPVRRNERPR